MTYIRDKLTKLKERASRSNSLSELREISDQLQILHDNILRRQDERLARVGRNGLLSWMCTSVFFDCIGLSDVMPGVQSHCVGVCLSLFISYSIDLQLNPMIQQLSKKTGEVSSILEQKWEDVRARRPHNWRNCPD